jgi:hypothetical protein
MGFSQFLKERGDQFRQFADDGRVKFDQVRQSPEFGYGLDLAGGAAAGYAGQTALNALLPGQDYNPLLSAAVAAPVLGRAISPYRQNISMLQTRGEITNPTLNGAMSDAYNASIAGIGTAGAAVGYNTLTGGDNININNVAPLVALAAMAPTAYRMLVNSKKVPDVQGLLG